jgi:hypothetical protein
MEGLSGFIMTGWEQKAITLRDIDERLSQQASLYRTAKGAATIAQDVLGTEFRSLRMAARKQLLIVLTLASVTVFNLDQRAIG